MLLTIDLAVLPPFLSYRQDVLPTLINLGPDVTGRRKRLHQLFLAFGRYSGYAGLAECLSSLLLAVLFWDVCISWHASYG